MKTNIIYCIRLFVCYVAIAIGSLSLAYGQTSDDNEIFINQSGDTITLQIDQIGYGNKVGGSTTSSVVDSDWTLTGTTLTIDIDQVGNNNQLLGSTIFSSSAVSLTTTGDSNIINWDIGDIGSSDSSDIFIDFTGDSNVLTFNQGSVASSERLDFDLTVIGGSNTFDVDIEAEDVIWNVDITGDSNDFVSSIKDGSYNELKLDFTGDSGDIDINQWSGSCPTGVLSCYGVIDATFNSDNATITINQKDTTE